MIRGQSTDVPERDEEPYRQVRDALVATPPRDVAHRLPNLVETVVRVSGEPDTEVFLIGVSFSREHTPLDYELDRVVDRGADGYRRESLKDPVSREHRYVRFSYPPDPQFDACALRGALLGALETELPGVDDGGSALGARRNESPDGLPGRLYERLSALF